MFGRVKPIATTDEKNELDIPRVLFYFNSGALRDIYRAVALQHEPLRADDKRRGQQARSICGHRVQSHSQQIRHEVSANGAVQRTICCA